MDIITGQARSCAIPPQFIQHDGVQPLAFDGMELYSRLGEQGITLAAHYNVGPNLRGVLRRRYSKDECHCVMKGGIVDFTHCLSWPEFERISAESVIKLSDLVRPKACSPHHAVYNFLMARLVALTISPVPDAPSQIEFVLQFKDGLEFKQQISREAWGDIFPP